MALELVDLLNAEAMHLADEVAYRGAGRNVEALGGLGWASISAAAFNFWKAQYYTAILTRDHFTTLPYILHLSSNQQLLLTSQLLFTSLPNFSSPHFPTTITSLPKNSHLLLAPCS